MSCKVTGEGSILKGAGCATFGSFDVILFKVSLLMIIMSFITHITSGSTFVGTPTLFSSLVQSDGFILSLTF